VAKRAYILSKQLKEYQDIGQRIRAIFFLATPHRGSNMAELLSRILQVASGSRPFVTDLHPNSVMVQSINEEFPHHCQELYLHSFYETTAMSFGVKKAIVVPKDSAILGYENERSGFLSNANHREVCKFGNDQDPNYLAVRNGIAMVLDELRGKKQLVRTESDYAQQLWLKECLDINDGYDDDFQRVDSERIGGSCAWIEQRKSFQSWRDSSEPQMFWLAAKPGTGKSIMSGFAIKHLTELNKDCQFYFFTYGDKSKFGIGLLLRSIAWQMSCKHRIVFDYVLKQCKKDAHLAAADYRTIWRKLFLDGIFRLHLPTQQYLVIDALDECVNDAELVPLLVKAAEVNALRVFLTSRNTFDMYGILYPATLSIISENIPPESAIADIELYIHANLHNLPALGPDKDRARELMMQSILKKSNGCFLWVRLVLSELRRVHTAEEVRQVLEDVPSDMDELYSRILDTMSSTLKRGKPLTKAILAWTACASRPLTTDELHEALQLDINDSIDSVERSISSTCGHLVEIDKATSRVQMVHQTAREFLIRPNNRSEFASERRECHRRLAMVCLKYLSGSEMAGSKNRKLSASFVPVANARSPFLAYAANALPDHIAFVPSEDDEFLHALGRFLGSHNLLSWIEYIARNSDINRLIHTGRALRHYLQRRSKYVVPFGRDVALLDAWSVDLIRLVTRFGKNLSASPTSIYHLIPPFCPPETALNRQFATSHRSIRVNGLKVTTWDDCSSVINYKREIPTAISASTSLFAVGQKGGQIKIHQETSCQEMHTLIHNEAIKLLRFGDNGDFLVSVAAKSICVWDIRSWQRLWRFEIGTPCMDLSFVDNDRLLLVALKDNRLLIWDMATGSGRELTSWVDELDEEYVSDRPITASIGCGSTMLAVAYRGQDVIVWDIEEETIHDIYGQDIGSLGPRATKRSGVSLVWSLLYSPAPESDLLAVGYNDGEIVVFNTMDQKIQARAPANAHSLVSSSDGILMACGNSAGAILIFEFESLKLLYRIVSEEYSVKSLVFSADNLRLIDIRGPYCRVWDPPVLLRDTSEDEHNSDTVSVSTAPQDYLIDDTEQIIHISAFCCIEDADVVVCGKIDGSILIYDGKSGEERQALVRNSHDNSITCLFYESRSKVLISADIDSWVISYRLIKDGNKWDLQKLFEHRTGTAVLHVLANEGFTRLLISTRETDSLFAITPESSHILKTIDWPDRRLYKWSVHPVNQQLILVLDTSIHLFSFESFQKLTSETGIQMTGSILPELSIRAITSCFDGRVIATTFAESLASRSKSKLLLWHASDFSPEKDAAAPIPHYQPLAAHVECIIGTYNHRLVFLHQDGWICSADPQNFDVEFYDRHFFLPADWMSATPTGGLMLSIFPHNGTIVFVQRDEVAIIQKGMNYFEGGQSKGISKRPSLIRSTRSDSSHSTVDRFLSVSEGKD